MIIHSYLKSGLRNFVSNKATSFINILGLSSTIAIGLAVYLIIDRQLNLDKFHPDAERIFTIQSVINWDRSEQKWARTPQLLGKSFQDDFPQIEYMTRVNVKSAVIRFEDKVFSERLTFADQDFFNIFDFPLIFGDHSSLTSGKNNIILSKLLAEKYFDNTNVIGHELRVIINNEAHLFTVTGVAEKFPETASFGFDFLLSMDNLATLYDVDLNTWKNVNKRSVFTFVKIDDLANLGFVKETSHKYIDIVNQANPDWPIDKFDFESITTAAQNSQYTRECLACGSTPEALIIFGIISLVLFVSACFNYVNIAIASSSKRLKEIGLRKVIGGSRGKIIQQFMFENLVFSFIAVVVGIVIAKGIIIPGMNDIFGGDNLTLNFTENTRLPVFVFLVFIVVGISSGAYPAWYISSFKPLEIFKGKEQLVGKNKVTKVFLTFQFFLTFIAIVSGLIFTQTNKSQLKQDWGYDQNNLLVVPIKNNEQFEVLSQFCDQSVEVTSSSASRTQIGRSEIDEVVEVSSKKSSIDAFYVSPNYIDTYDLELVWGRGFNKNLSTDVDNSIIVNQKFLETFNWDLNSEQQLKLENGKYNIIGVVKDFHHNNFFEPITPSLFRISDPAKFNYVSIRTKNDQTQKVEKEVKALWKSSFPDELYKGYLQADAFSIFFQQTGILIDIMNFTSVMAIILSAMGLFGLVSLLIIKRLKELSIRNVLGASKFDVLKLITFQFTWILGIAIIFAIPVGYFTFDSMLSQMFLGSSAEVSWVPFTITLLIIVSIITATVFFHVRSLLKSNPVENLRID